MVVNTWMRMLVIVSLLFLSSVGKSEDSAFWRESSHPGMTSTNDCGFISEILGTPQIRRSFMSEKDAGLPAYIADRIHSGDELAVPPGGRLEWTCGNNVIVMLGAGAKAKIEGLRVFQVENGVSASRLDIRLLEGSMRVQARLNEERPEGVLVSVEGAEVLLTRGDVQISAGSPWRVAAISGLVSARLRRGNVVGAPFGFSESVMVEGQGEESLDEEELVAIKFGLPFSFETKRAALPPLPAASALLEAP